MKTYKIGRDENCQILLSDERISRNHAVLRMNWYGKMEIVDTSQNGTFVNGTRIPKGRPFPLSRGNSVNFAHVENLDWKLISNPPHKICGYAAVCAGLIAIVVLLVMIIPTSSNTTNPSGVDDGGGIYGGGSSTSAKDKEERKGSDKSSIKTYFPQGHSNDKPQKKVENSTHKAPTDIPQDEKNKTEEKKENNHKDEEKEIIM